MSTLPALKPCPHCKPTDKPVSPFWNADDDLGPRNIQWVSESREWDYEKTGPWQVKCDRCEARGPIRDTEAESAAAWNERSGEAALLAACRDSAAFFDEIIKGFNITNDDAQSIRLRDQLRAAIASVEPQSERT